MQRALALLLAALLAGACGGKSRDDRSQGGRSESPCGTPVEEPLDPRSTQHVVAGSPEPHYPSDPPTSGPHQGGAPPRGLQSAPLPRPVQVAILEGGSVLVQHRQLAAPERAELETLVAEGAVVAPNPTLGAPVVATAWRHRLECRTVDLGAIRAFVAARRGRGPAH